MASILVVIFSVLALYEDTGRPGPFHLLAVVSIVTTGLGWLSLQGRDAGTTFEDFFSAARLHPRASSITGTICGVRIEDIDDPLMQKIRYLDKLVDELARGRSMDKILRA